MLNTLLLWTCVAVFVLADVALLYAALRVKSRGGKSPIDQTDKLWIAIPLVASALSAVTYVTVRGTAPAATPPSEPAIVSTVAPATEPVPVAETRIADGKGLYEAKCASCHHSSGAGIPDAFPPIAGAEVPNGPKDAHIKIVLDGKTGPTLVLGKPYNGAMPPWKDQLSAAEIAAIVTYERTAFGNKGGAVTQDEVLKLGGKP